uniref:Uncharacterized protein n=1 Tax=Tetradesmus obliquus TaxID=3088 RepID=A0A383WED3_TETOB|eukprot:jgi/Sobl393_1/18686/SZX75965.1
MKAPVVAALLLAALVAADALQPVHLSQDSISEPATSPPNIKDTKADAAAATASRSLLDTKVAATDNSHQDAAAAASAVTGPATDSKPVEQQQEAAAAANRGGFGRGSFGSGGHYGPSSWGRRLQADAAPDTPSQGRALLAAELLAAEELMSPSTPASAAAAAAATAMLERATDGGRYGPSSYMYAGSRPSRYDFGSMWAGGARRLQGSAAAAAAAEGQERSGRGGARGSFGGGGGRFGPSSYFRGRRLASFDAAMAAEMVAAAHHVAPPQLSHPFNGNLKYKTTYGPGYFWDPRSV